MLKGLGDFSRKVKGDVFQLNQIVGVVIRDGTFSAHWLVICLAKGVDLQGRMMLAEEDTSGLSCAFEVVIHLDHHMRCIGLRLGMWLQASLSQERVTRSAMNSGRLVLTDTLDIIRIDFGGSFLLFGHSQHKRISRQSSHSSSGDHKLSGALGAAQTRLISSGVRRFGSFVLVLLLLVFFFGLLCVTLFLHQCLNAVSAQ